MSGNLKAECRHAAQEILGGVAGVPVDNIDVVGTCVWSFISNSGGVTKRHNEHDSKLQERIGELIIGVAKNPAQANQIVQAVAKRLNYDLEICSSTNVDPEHLEQALKYLWQAQSGALVGAMDGDNYRKVGYLVTAGVSCRREAQQSDLRM
ncbi:MAG: hypothetical protein P4M13_03900 [Alphaproteobacteria bacterium]|nr:hypothetical protein [Alphaproteobacteria bacterium]